MKRFLWFLVVVLLWLSGSSCSVVPLTQNARPDASLTSTQPIEKKYSDALKKWQDHQIPHYEITVQVFSSLLPPPCQTKAVLFVEDNKLIAVTEIEPPVPLQAPNGKLLYNPECSDYERYLMARQFELLDKLIKGELPERLYEVSFNADYGYIAHLVFGTGETMKDIRFSDFEPK